MMKNKLLSLQTLLFTVAIVLFDGQASALAAEQDINLKTSAVYETKLVLRDLWVEHVFWVRNYVDAAHHQNNDAANTAESEIVSNAQSIASTIEPFYGEEASDGLFNLLAGHWGAIKSYNSAVLVDNNANKDRSVKELTDNARKISAFLSGANPYLPEDAVFSLLSAHGGHHVSQINQFYVNDYVAEAKTWAAMRKHMFVIADAIADALAKQFPRKFYL